MRIRWTVAAADDLQRIHDYLGEHEPHLARPTVTALHEAILILEEVS
jgi:plasmid stabilization system protein ParE